MKIALMPRGTGSGHNMRAYAIAEQIRIIEKEASIDAYIGSLQSMFTPMFERIGAKVIDTSPEKEVDYTKKSNLTKKLNWKSMMEDYMLPNSFNSAHIMNYVKHLEANPADVVVSDFNYSALIAANICGIPSVMVTERYNFVIVNSDDEALESAGFEVNRPELKEVRDALNRFFAWGAEHCSKILTDRPYIESLDQGTVAEMLLKKGKMQFVGPMVREVDPSFDRTGELATYGIPSDAFVLLATVGGTSMFKENVKNTRACYIEAFKKVKEQIPKAHMLLIARDEMEVPEGVTCLRYVPDWLNLLRSVDVLVAHPGWITVAECSNLNIPAVFTLSSGLEFHEHESFIRLKSMGYFVHDTMEPSELAAEVIKLQDEEQLKKLFEAYKYVCPNGNGAAIAAKEILEIARENVMRVSAKAV